LSAERRIEIGRAHRHEFEAIVALVDDELVHKRGRCLSLAKRLPSTLAPGNMENLYVLRQGGEVVGCVAVKRRRWLGPGDVLGGSLSLGMIGALCARPGICEQGLTQGLLRQVTAELRALRVDAAVLWTRTAGFYEQLGWQPHDLGLFGALRETLDLQAGGWEVQRLEPGAAEPSGMAELRARWAIHRMARTQSDWQTVPAPAEGVDALIALWHGVPGAYALVGRSADAAYVYEAPGDPAAFADLWLAIRRSYRQVFVNECVGSPTVAFLDQVGAVDWVPQQLAMWLPLGAGIGMDAIRAVHVPYFDRI
jgi:predicted N-acetyltransferase YhbS